MKKLFTLILLIVSIPVKGQELDKLKLINDAELAISASRLEDAANIYAQLFTAKDKIWAQDIYNAAVVELQLGSLEKAKPYLNELARRGIKISDLETIPIFEEMKESFDWKTYTNFYNQIADYAEQSNEYTLFLDEMSTNYDSLWTWATDAYYIPIRTSTADSTKISYKGEVLYAIPNTQLSDTVQQILRSKIDSVQMEPSRIALIARYKQESSVLLDKYISFFESHNWPNEKELNEARVFSLGNKLNSLVMNLFYMPEMGVSSKGLIEASTTNAHFYPRLFRGEDSLSIAKPVLKGLKNGRIKPLTALQIFNYDDFLKIQNFKIHELKVSESDDCESLNGKFFINEIAHKTDFLERFEGYQKDFGLESLENFNQKAKFCHSAERPFSFNVRRQFELSAFSGCARAKEFIKEMEPFNVENPY